MGPIAIPSMGVSLSEFPSTDNGQKKSRAPQAIEVTLNSETTLEELVKVIRKNPGDSMVTLGKKPAILVDKKPIPIQTTYKPRGLLYRLDFDSDRLEFSARSNLKDALAREKSVQSQGLDMSDPALLALQQSLSQHRQMKESSTAIFVKDSSKLPPAKSGKKALSKTASHSFLKSHRKGLFDQGNVTTRSLPTSPSLGGVTPSRMPNNSKSRRAEAMKVSLIHLLAVRAVSEKYIVSTLKCSVSDLKPLLEKYGRESRFDSSKFDLSDKGYKELDVWKFPYTAEDRQAAIDRAVTAFDRQRISVVEKVWQMLLVKEERNKGKVLSKLKLHEGPIERVKTPRINVEPTDSVEVSSQLIHNDEAEKNGRLTPSDAHAMVRSKSQDPIKKQKISEKESQTKRLMSKDSKKATTMTKTKETKSIGKSSSVDDKKKAKKGSTKKDAPVTGSKIKSEEFVHDSDDDMDLDEMIVNIPPTKSNTIAAGPKPTLPKATITKKIVSGKKITPAQRPTIPKTDEAKFKKVESQPKPSATKKSVSPVDTKVTNTNSVTQKPRASDASQRSVAMARTSSHKRSGSSPMKPSPLGSSPPTNASDLENEQVLKSSKSSSSSASPLINQRRDMGAKKTNSNLQQVKSPEGNSDRSLKRKANDIDSDIHQHGNIPITNGNDRPTKRQQHTPPSPPSSSSSSSDSSSSVPPLLSARNIDYSRSFKNQQAKYDALLRELQNQADPPPDKVERLHRMYTRLIAHKAEIWKLVKAGM